MQKVIRAILVVAILISLQSAAASIYKRPRRAYVLSTEHFDFIFPKGTESTVYFLAQNADALFENAYNAFEGGSEGGALVVLKKKLRIPCAITFDSDKLAAKYSPAPLNRIILYAAYGSSSDTTNDALLSALNGAIVEAIASNVHTNFWRKFSNKTTLNAFQFATLFNIPSAFLDGAIDEYVANADDAGDSPLGIFSDGKVLQTLIQAKSAGLLATWRNATGARDIYPVGLGRVACSAFAAYIQSRWGFQKFYDYWRICGGVSYFKLTNGLFKKIYGVPLTVAWHDFVGTIPTNSYDDFGRQIFLHDKEGLYSILSPQDGGFVYFDSARKNLYSVLLKQQGEKTRHKKKFLTWASEVVSTNCLGDNIAISYVSYDNNDKLKKYSSRVFSKKGRGFKSNKVDLRNAVLFNNEQDKMMIAGFCVRGNKARLEIYDTTKTMWKTPDFSLGLPAGILLDNLFSLSSTKLLCTYYYNKQCVLCLVDIAVGAIQYATVPVNATSFCLCKSYGDGEAKKTVLLFSYIPESQFDFLDYHKSGEAPPSCRVGYIAWDGEQADGMPRKAYLGEDDFAGGMHNPVLVAQNGTNTLYFTKDAGLYQELRAGDFGMLHFRPEMLLPLATFSRHGGSAAASSTVSKVEKSPVHDTLVKGQSIKRINLDGTYTLRGTYLGDYRVKNYDPLKFMQLISITQITPFFPITNFTTTGYETNPGVGFRYKTGRDVLDLLDFDLSFTWAYIDTSEETFTIHNNFTTAFIVNSSYLPFDLSLGILWQFDQSGSYDIKSMVVTTYNIFPDMSIHKLHITLRWDWDCTTEYKDYDLQTVVHLKDWPSVFDAYNTIRYIFAFDYNNYHQSGRSGFEVRGFEAGISLINVFDPQKKQKVLDYENQLTMSLTFGVKMPCLLPIFNTGNFVLTMPFSIYARFYGEENTSFESYVEALVFGYELQEAIPGLPFYVNRLGITVGYKFDLECNMLVNAATDFRRVGRFLTILKDSTIDDYLYFDVKAILSPNIGKFVKKQATLGARFKFALHDNWAFNVQMIFNMQL